MRLDRIRPALVAMLLAAAAPACAQTARPMLDYASAAKIRDGCLAVAGEKGLALGIAVFDNTGRLIAFAKMDGASTGAAELAQWKGKSAAVYGFPTSETAKWNGYSAPDMSTFEGGVPFYGQDGTQLGGVGVSGGESKDDVACGLAGVAAAGLRGTAK
jgi:glc operon protein GlcG